MPLHPKIAQMLEMVERAKRPAYYEQGAQQARAAYEKSAGILDMLPAEMASVERVEIPARDGVMLPATLYLPVEPSLAEPLPVLLFFHGGGFTVGSPATHDALTRMFARDAQCAVLSVDYRLAPEHKFPTAHEDAEDAMLWLHGNAERFGLDAERIAVGGDSAGGTLAAVCALLAPGHGIRLVLQMLLYPGVSAHQDLDSHRRYADGYLLTSELIRWFFAQYVRDDADREDWRFAPLDGKGAPSFAGLAPAWIASAEFDPLCDEDEAYAGKLRAAGNQVTYVCYPGMIHEFFKLAGFVPDVHAAHAEAVAVLRAAFEG
jgi:acetyl esterase